MSIWLDSKHTSLKSQWKTRHTSNKTYRKGEVPRLRNAKLAWIDGFDVKSQQQINNGIDGQHDEDIAEGEVIVGWDATVYVVPLDAFTGSFKHGHELRGVGHGRVGEKARNQLVRPRQTSVAQLQEEVRAVRDEPDDASSSRSGIGCLKKNLKKLKSPCA